MTMLQMLTEMGAKRWQKAGNDRMYLPEKVAAAGAGLRYTLYGSGNVRSATLDGDHCSNGTARDMIEDLRGIYYDVPSGTVQQNGKPCRYLRAVSAYLDARLAERNAPTSDAETTS